MLAGFSPLTATGGSDDSRSPAPVNSDAPPAALPPSWRWWAARALLAQQRLLSGRASSIQAALQTLVPHSVDHYAGDGGAHAVSTCKCVLCLLRYINAASVCEMSLREYAVVDPSTR